VDEEVLKVLRRTGRLPISGHRLSASSSPRARYRAASAC
jgi:hypothetical protein